MLNQHRGYIRILKINLCYDLNASTDGREKVNASYLCILNHKLTLKGCHTPLSLFILGQKFKPSPTWYHYVFWGAKVEGTGWEKPRPVVLRDYSWWCCKDYMECQTLNQGWMIQGRYLIHYTLQYCHFIYGRGRCIVGGAQGTIILYWESNVLYYLFNPQYCQLFKIDLGGGCHTWQCLVYQFCAQKSLLQDQTQVSCLKGKYPTQCTITLVLRV